MHNNFYFLKQISEKLAKELDGFTLVSCFSQNKDEIVFEFNDAKSSVFIRGDLQGDFSCLTFPTTFKRARKNSVDLFNEAIMKKVVGTRQFSNERSFAVELEAGYAIVFKMHGNRANVMLALNGVTTEIFKNSLQQDFGLDINTLDRNIDWSEEAFYKNIDNLDKLYFTFGRRVWDYLGKPLDLVSLKELLFRLDEKIYSVFRDRGDIYLSLLPEDKELLGRYDDPFEAVNAFYNIKVSRGTFEKEKHSILSTLKSEIAGTRTWLEKTARRMGELRSDEHYKMWGDLLMANLHAVEEGQGTIELDDFYNPGKKVTVKLDPQLSPQKNAERYYRKGKNQVIEATKLTEAIESKSKALAKLQANLERAELAADLDSLRSLSPTRKVLARTAASLPYREFEYKGFRVWVGKDAKNNDELTLKYSYKEDLWLHVRDEAGSHVLLKYQSGKPFPKDVIEYAAGIAAYNSKRKNESLCPVIVTPKKFVRKRKGDLPGSVVVEREEVILVEPRKV